MRRFSRVGLVAMMSVVLVSIGIGVGVFVAGGGSGSDEAKVTIDQPVTYDGRGPGPSDAEITKSGAEGFTRASHELAGKLLTPQVIANTYYVADAVAQFNVER